MVMQMANNIVPADDFHAFMGFVAAEDVCPSSLHQVLTSEINTLCHPSDCTPHEDLKWAAFCCMTAFAQIRQNPLSTPNQRRLASLAAKASEDTWEMLRNCATMVVTVHNTRMQIVALAAQRLPSALFRMPELPVREFILQSGDYDDCYEKYWDDRIVIAAGA